MLIGAVLFGLALLGSWFVISAWREGMAGGRDFVQDYAAVVKIGQGRNPYEPYNDVTQALFGGPPHKGALYSFHAPSSLPLLVWLLPFANVGGYPAAFLAWGIASVAAFWASCWMTLRVLGAPRPAILGLLAALALMTFPAIRESFEEGQLNVVVAAGMVGCWAARRSGRSTLAGVLLGIGFALKPIPGLFFLYYAWRRDWRLLGAAGITVVALSVVGVGLAGIDGTWLWATINYPSHADVWPGYPDNASVRGFLTRIFGPSDWRPRPRYPLPYASLLLWAAIGGLLMLGAMLVALAGTRRAFAPSVTPRWLDWLRWLLAPPRLAPSDPRNDLEIAVLTVLTLLITPIVWPHYYVVLVMPVAVVATFLGRLVLCGAARQDTDGSLSGASAGSSGRRIVSLAALGVVGCATLVLGQAQYVEPYAGVGGYNLAVLLALYGASLAALAWAARCQGRGVRPDELRYSAI
jgi:hypothetical protein